ncbi:hypothetical protein ARMGADRAFT_92384 [Armillaria gallica]|uniref:Uncharacterized protein n=1 Tax=Armillaria gallica TaxID=47427 RepID=A0A2H3DZI5_ARMGA|nr:hypothetical protein ARMGADRAFT_92384 [Armillaria gallica]
MGVKDSRGRPRFTVVSDFKYHNTDLRWFIVRLYLTMQYSSCIRILNTVYRRTSIISI